MKLDTTRRSREAMRTYLAAALDGCYIGEPTISPIEGGRTAAERQLAAFDARRYASRNHVTRGHVSRLSPYIRHGVLTLREVRDAIFARFGRSGESIYKFVFELAWHQFWQEVYAALGDGIYADIEDYKFSPPVWEMTLPEDVARAETGLVCMDETLRELYTTGYLHNHARMWFAAYLIHHRKVHWSVGERLFLRICWTAIHPRTPCPGSGWPRPSPASPTTSTARTSRSTPTGCGAGSAPPIVPSTEPMMNWQTCSLNGERGVRCPDATVKSRPSGNVVPMRS